MEELLSYVHSLRDEIEKLKSELEIRPPPKKRRVVEERIQCKGTTSKGGPFVVLNTVRCMERTTPDLRSPRRNRK